ncbi:ThiF family adenylyltransferase [Brevibacillus laterosporus]|uniref:ThiF family adenylyltransferase n=1 Tax=Brevibacillus laterosporus TaxID=1465 RepID=UPI0035A63E91
MSKFICLTNSDKVKYRIVCIGAGGNGSHFFRNMCQDVRSYLNVKDDLSVDITIVDADIVEQKNIGNQVFTSDDIGEPKVVCLAERYGEAYDLNIKRVVQYCRDIEMLQKLFANVNETFEIPILISMVDNNRSRQLFDDFFYSTYLESLIYLDAGIEGVDETLSIEDQNRSGFSGQVVVGFKWKGRVLLEPVTRVYENIMNDNNTIFPGESCSDLIVNHPQRCNTNKFAAQIANSFINNLFHTRTIFWHYVNFNSQLCLSKPTYIEPAAIDLFNTLEKS